MRDCLLWLACAGSIAACGSKVQSSSVAPVASEEPAELGLDVLRKSLESTVLENYDQLNSGNLEALSDGVVADRGLQFVGVTSADFIVGRRRKDLRRDRRLFKTRNPRLLSKNLDVRLSKDGSVGWIYDEMSLRVDYEGREASIPIRSTALFVRDVDRWVIASEHLSYGYPIEDIVLLATQGNLPDSPRFKVDYGGSREDAAPLIGLSGLFVNAGGAEALANDRQDTLVLLPGAALEFQGSEAPALAKLFGEQATVAVKSFHIQMGESGRVAWMLASLAIQTRHNGDAIRIPLRSTFVFEREPKGDWGIVQAHISVGLSEEQLGARVFGPS